MQPTASACCRCLYRRCNYCHWCYCYSCHRPPPPPPRLLLPLLLLLLLLQYCFSCYYFSSATTTLLSRSELWSRPLFIIDSSSVMRDHQLPPTSKTRLAQAAFRQTCLCLSTARRTRGFGYRNKNTSWEDESQPFDCLTSACVLYYNAAGYKIRIAASEKTMIDGAAPQHPTPQNFLLPHRNT